MAIKDTVILRCEMLQISLNQNYATLIIMGMIVTSLNNATDDDDGVA